MTSRVVFPLIQIIMRVVLVQASGAVMSPGVGEHLVRTMTHTATLRKYFMMKNISATSNYWVVAT